MPNVYQSKYSGSQIDGKLDLLKSDQGTNKFLRGDGAYAEIPTSAGEQGPPGEDGLPGEDGVGIASIEKTSTNGLVDTYTITYTDSTTSSFNVTNGKNGTDGKDGITPTFSIGDVQTLAAGSSAIASITGTAENPVLNLGIPKGKDGTGSSGESAGPTYYYKPVIVATSANKYWKRDGSIGDSSEETDASIKKVSATNTDQYLPVVEGEVYRITIGSVGGVTSSFNVSQCVFLNDSDEFVANAFGGSSWHDKELVTVPEGATKMHFTVWSGVSFRIEKQTTEQYGIINKEEHLNYLNMLQKEQHTFARKTFAPFDKAYVTFVNDDNKTVVSEIVDVFVEKGVPLCLASLYGAFNNLASSGTVLDAVKKAVENGGEVLSHAGSPITANTIDDFDTLYDQFAKSKEMLQMYGFDVNGIILAGGTGQIVGSDKTDKWVRAYYQYSDLYGSENYGYPYYHYRSALSNFTLDKAKARIDEAITKKEWLVFYLHEWAEFSKANMESLLDYVNGKDSRELEAVTYKQVYDRFCMSYPKQLVTITANKTTKVYESGSEIATDDITITAYYSDGSTEQVTNGITVDISDVDMSTSGNYYMSVSYNGKTAYVPIEIYSSGERTVLYSGKEGNIKWELYSDGVMELTNTVTWKCNIPDYSTDGTQPWYDHMSEIKKVKINAGSYGIGTIGARAFLNANNLIEVDLSENTQKSTLQGYCFGNCGFKNPTITNAGIVNTNVFNASTMTGITIDCDQLANNAFAGCTALKEVTITNPDVTIDSSSFYGVKDTVTDIYVPWSEGAKSGAPWGASNATVHYDTV